MPKTFAALMDRDRRTVANEAVDRRLDFFRERVADAVYAAVQVSDWVVETIPDAILELPPAETFRKSIETAFDAQTQIGEMTLRSDTLVDNLPALRAIVVDMAKALNAGYAAASSLIIAYEARLNSLAQIGTKVGPAIKIRPLYSAANAMVQEAAWLRMMDAEYHRAELEEMGKDASRAAYMRRHRALEKLGYRRQSVLLHERNVRTLERLGLLTPMGKEPTDDEIAGALDAFLGAAFATAEISGQRSLEDARRDAVDLWLERLSDLWSSQR